MLAGVTKTTERSSEREHGVLLCTRKQPPDHGLDLGPSEGDAVKGLGQIGRRPRLGAPHHLRDQGLNERVVCAPRPLDDIPWPGHAERVVAPRAEVALDGLGEGVSCHGGILPIGRCAATTAWASIWVQDG